MKRTLSIVLFCLNAFTLFAQQSPQYGQYIFNGLYINPAYAGYKDEIYLQAFYRAQWTGIKGGPQSFSVSLDAPINQKKISLGALVTKDKIGAQNSLNAVANLAYRLQLNEDDTDALAFGLGIGILQAGINGDLLQATEIGDLSVPVGLQSRMAPDVRAGIQYSTEKFFIGFSANNLIAPYLSAAKDYEILNLKMQSHFYLTAATIYKLNTDLIFKPSILLKDDFNGPTSADFNAFLLFKEKIWFGGVYRTSMSIYPKKHLDKNLSQKSALGFIAEFFIKPNLRLGYGYDYSLNKLGVYDNGSHEFSVGFYLNTIRSQKKICNCF